MRRIVYKLTTSDDKTRPGYMNETQWGEGITHTAHGQGQMCSNAFIHAYATPLIAVFMNPAHGDYKNPNLWRCIANVKINDGTKLGCTELKTIKRIKLPTVTINMKIAFGILCALKVYKEHSFVTWAKAWLHNKDRTATAAAYAANAAPDAATAATDAANAAARAAAYAARAAAYADAPDADAPDAATAAAYAATDAANAAARLSFILRASRRALKY